MKIKTSELEGAALDWAVAQCESESNEEMIVTITLGGNVNIIIEPDTCYHYSPSTDWSQGGPLIERYKVGVSSAMNGKWCAVKGLPHYAQTPLIAAMRALVTAELGDTVDVPKELN